jgi:hypothetical protein
MLPHGRHALAEHKRNVWFVSVPGDVTKDDLLTPSYWAPMSAKGEVRPCDEIIVHPDTGEWRMVFHVVMANQNGLTLALLQENSFGAEVESAATDPIGFDVQWRGPHAQFAVINRATKEVVKDKLPTKEQAFQMIRDIANPKAA